MSDPETWRRTAARLAPAGAATPPSPLVAELAALLLPQPAAIARLLAAHANDGTGRCRSCSSGAQSGRYLYPCVIRLAVDEVCRRSGEPVQ